MKPTCPVPPVCPCCVVLVIVLSFATAIVLGNSVIVPTTNTAPAAGVEPQDKDLSRGDRTSVLLSALLGKSKTYRNYPTEVHLMPKQRWFKRRLLDDNPAVSDGTTGLYSDNGVDLSSTSLPSTTSSTTSTTDTTQTAITVPARSSRKWTAISSFTTNTSAAKPRTTPTTTTTTTTTLVTATQRTATTAAATPIKTTAPTTTTTTLQTTAPTTTTTTTTLVTATQRTATTAAVTPIKTTAPTTTTTLQTTTPAITPVLTTRSSTLSTGVGEDGSSGSGASNSSCRKPAMAALTDFGRYGLVLFAVSITLAAICFLALLVDIVCLPKLRRGNKYNTKKAKRYSGAPPPESMYRPRQSVQSFGVPTPLALMAADNPTSTSINSDHEKKVMVTDLDETLDPTLTCDREDGYSGERKFSQIDPSYVSTFLLRQNSVRQETGEEKKD